MDATAAIIKNNNASSSNESGGVSSALLPPDMRFGEAQIITISVMSVLFLMSAALNLHVLSNLMAARRSVGLSRLNTLLLQLVLADLLVTFLMMPLEIGWNATVSWHGGDFLCRICAFFRIFGLFLSSNIVMCISIDRFLAILKPFSVRGSSPRTNRMLVVAWGLAVLLSLPQCYVFKLRYHPEYPWYGQCVTFGAFSSRSAEFLYFLLGMVFLYALPLFVIVVTWGGIVIHLHRVSKFGHATVDESDETKVSETTDSGRGTTTVSPTDGTMTSGLRRSAPGMLGKAKLNTIRITLTLVGVFLACWTPYYVICLWFWTAKDSYEQVDYRVTKFLYLFACTNSCANPLIYGVFSSRHYGGAGNGVLPSREKDLVLPSGTAHGQRRGRSGWIGNQKYRLAARRQSTFLRAPNHGLNKEEVTTNCARITKRFLSVSLPGSGNRSAGLGRSGVILNHTVVGVVTPTTAAKSLSHAEENGDCNCNGRSSPKMAAAVQTSETRQFLDNIIVVKRSDTFL